MEEMADVMALTTTLSATTMMAIAVWSRKSATIVLVIGAIVMKQRIQKIQYVNHTS